MTSTSEGTVEEAVTKPVKESSLTDVVDRLLAAQQRNDEFIERYCTAVNDYYETALKQSQDTTAQWRDAAKQWQEAAERAARERDMWRDEARYWIRRSNNGNN